MSNVYFSQNDDGTYLLIMNSTIEGNRIIPDQEETVTFVTQDCFFWYDLCFVEDESAAVVTINDKEYLIASPLWEEVKDVVGPLAAWEIECKMIEHETWVPEPTTQIQ